MKTGFWQVRSPGGAPPAAAARAADGPLSSDRWTGEIGAGAGRRAPPSDEIQRLEDRKW